MDMNTIIVNNIIDVMKEKNKKQIDLAGDIGVSRQIMSKMLNGGRVINAVDLAALAKALNVSTERLVELPKERTETNAVRAFMGSVNTDAARKGLEIAETLATMIVFHTKAYHNGMKMIGNSEE